MNFQTAGMRPAMSANVPNHIECVADGRIAGMTTYPLGEILLPARAEPFYILANEAP